MTTAEQDHRYQYADYDTIEAPGLAATRRLGSVSTACRDVLSAFIVTRLLLLLVGLLTSFFILPLMKTDMTRYGLPADTRLPDALWLMWQRFDSGWYREIAVHGYWPPSTLSGKSNWVFYPLYPILVRPFGHLFSMGATTQRGIDTGFYLAGLLISNVALLVALFYLYALARREFGRSVAAKTVLYMALFPTSFFLSSVYPHSLFLACAVACLYYARGHRWWPAGICGGLAALTHTEGILLVIPLAWEMWQAFSDRYAPVPAGATGVARLNAQFAARVRGPLLALRERDAWAALASLAVIPLGTFAFLLYAKIKTGDFLAPSHNEVLWGRSLTMPWTTLLHALRHPEFASPMAYDFWLLDVGSALIFLLFAVWAFKRLPISLALYTLLVVLFPLASGSMQSLARYYTAAFPALMLLALWSDRNDSPERHNAIVSVFAVLLAVFMSFFVLGLPAIA